MSNETQPEKWIVVDMPSGRCFISPDTERDSEAIAEVFLPPACPDMAFGMDREVLKRRATLIASAPTLEARALAAEQRVKDLEEALTASGDTKAAYIGEFKETITVQEPDDVGEMNEADRTITISWTTTKEIMAAILARANAHTALKKDTHT